MYTNNNKKCILAYLVSILAYIFVMDIINMHNRPLNVDIVIIFRDTCTHNTRCSYTVKNAHAEMETFVIQTYYEIKLFL